MSKSNTTNIPNSLQEHWMPFTSNRDFKENPRLITEAKGIYLKDHHGRTHIDASSGLFCNPLGHGRKEIINAVTKQLEQLDYVQPFQQGFGGSFELATKISKHTPGNLNRIFYTICGSSAVETAIKIVIAYHKAKGQGQRFRFVGRERNELFEYAFPLGVDLITNNRVSRTGDRELSKRCHLPPSISTRAKSPS